MPTNIAYKIKNSEKSVSTKKSSHASAGNDFAGKSPANSLTSIEKERNVFKKLFFLLLAFILIFSVILYSNPEIISGDFSSIETFWSNLWNRSPPISSKQICIDSKISKPLKENISNWASELEIKNKFRELSLKDIEEEGCDIAVTSQDLGGYDLAWKKYYVLVTALDSQIYDISSEEFRQLIGGESLLKNDKEYDLIVSVYARTFLENNFGVGVTIPFSENVEADILQNSNSIGIIPFEDVSSKVRIVELDGYFLPSPIIEDQEYLLVDQVWVKESENLGIFSSVREFMGPINFQRERVTTVVVTGTSVVGARGLYFKILETEDPLYPIREIAPIFQSADIAHISNESSFAKGCMQYMGTLSFCGTEESFEALTYAGIDVVGLTGNHILDAGVDNFLFTLDLFNNSGIEYFGGGRNLADGSEPAILDVKGIKYGFLGYNAIPPVSYFATATTPGSIQMDKQKMITDIEKVSKEVDFLFVDMQWGAEYQHEPVAYQLEFGRAAIDAGADFITGVHSHWVQPVEYYNDGLIFYSLGNLLFDQMWSQKTREGVMIKHVFYDGEYIGFYVIPTMIFEAAQPRPVDGEDALRIRNYIYGIY